MTEAEHRAKLEAEHYADHVAECQAVGIAPLPFDQWRVHVGAAA